MCTSIGGPSDRKDKKLILDVDYVTCRSTCSLHAYSVICGKITHLEGIFVHIASQRMYNWGFHHILLVPFSK